VRLRSNLLSLVVGALALVGLGGQAQALGIPVSLASLVAGGTLTSEDGNFTFSDFGASVAGAISSNLNDYNVQALTSGFRITGAFLVADGNFGDMVLGFRATAKPGIAITDAHLFFNGSFNGNDVPAGMGTSVNETIFVNDIPIAQLSVASSSGGFVKLTDEVVFGATTSIVVLKDIALSSFGGQGGSVAHISIVDQTFTFIPEPGTLLLGSVGLLGLATLGRKRVR